VNIARATAASDSPVEAVQPAPESRIRNGLDIKDQDVHARAAAINAFMSRTALAQAP
jgi:hypothetical protein